VRKLLQERVEDRRPQYPSCNSRAFSTIPPLTGPTLPMIVSSEVVCNGHAGARVAYLIDLDRVRYLVLLRRLPRRLWCPAPGYRATNRLWGPSTWTRRCLRAFVVWTGPAVARWSSRSPDRIDASESGRKTLPPRARGMNADCFRREGASATLSGLPDASLFLRGEVEGNRGRARGSVEVDRDLSPVLSSVTFGPVLDAWLAPAPGSKAPHRRRR